MDPRRAAIATLALDRATVEAVRALQAADVPSILLKGRSFATWLYGPDEVRPYTDVDLLVPVARWDDARRVLDGLGYAPSFAPRHDPPHASSHGRDDGMHIDLHRTLQGLSAPPADVWDALSGHTATSRLGDVDVTVLDEVGRCLAVAVHAGRTDATGVRARDDLRRAVAVADAATWARARELAADVGGTTAFATGLASEPSAAGLATSIGVAPVAPATPRTRGANTLDRAVAADTLAGTLRALLPWLVPNPGLLRQTRPLARRGTLGLVVAYLTWPIYLLVQLVRAVVARR